jgi:hypothetical protein
MASVILLAYISLTYIQFEQAAIVRYDGFEWRGKLLKVQDIIDHPERGRVKVPEKLVAYVSGQDKRTRKGQINILRRISKDDVDRLSRGESTKKKYGSRAVAHRLNKDERAEMDRASKRGFLTLTGGRKGSALANLHRQWCDARGKPQIVHQKAAGGRSLDMVFVDLSPLRLYGLFDDPRQAEDFLIKWKVEILSAASDAGMDLHSTEEAKEDESDFMNDATTELNITIGEHSSEAWATQPIWKLPVVSMGGFRGERAKAKAMTRAIAELWDIPENENNLVLQSVVVREDNKSTKGGKPGTKGLSEHRTRGGGHRQSWY